MEKRVIKVKKKSNLRKIIINLQYTIISLVIIILGMLVVYDTWMVYLLEEEVDVLKQKVNYHEYLFEEYFKG